MPITRRRGLPVTFRRSSRGGSVNPSVPPHRGVSSDAASCRRVRTPDWNRSRSPDRCRGHATTATSPSSTGRTVRSGLCGASRHPGHGTPPAGRWPRSSTDPSVVNPQADLTRSRWVSQPTTGTVFPSTRRNETASRPGARRAARHASHGTGGSVITSVDRSEPLWGSDTLSLVAADV